MLDNVPDANSGFGSLLCKIPEVKHTACIHMNEVIQEDYDRRSCRKQLF